MRDNEAELMADMDRSTDGVISMTRQQSCEQELIRDGLAYDASSTDHPLRHKLMENAEHAPTIFRGWTITPLDDRIIVEYASYKEGYACDSCKGKCHTDEVCPACDGKKYSYAKEFKKCFACDGKGSIIEGQNCGRCSGTGGTVSETTEPCTECMVVGEKGHNLLPSGFRKCESCGGSGLAPGVMAIPDESKQDHSYGDILSVGQNVYDLLPVDRVVFSKLAGIYLKGEARNCCLLRRGEIMGYMRKA